MNKIVVIFVVTFLLCIQSSQTHAQLYPVSYDVVIDVGHGGIDGGTSKNGILEKDINLAIGKKLYQALQKNYNVGITRTRDYALSEEYHASPIRSRHLKDLKQRELIAEALSPKLVVSLHVNWSKNKTVHGPVVIFQEKNEKSYFIAHLIQQHLNSFYGTKKLPFQGKSYFLMKNLDNPSVIVEMGYLSNPNDFKVLIQEETQDQIVATIAHAIDDYFLIYS